MKKDTTKPKRPNYFQVLRLLWRIAKQHLPKQDLKPGPGPSQKSQSSSHERNLVYFVDLLPMESNLSRLVWGFEECIACGLSELAGARNMGTDFSFVVAFLWS
jgi:hypothetical protein